MTALAILPALAVAVLGAAWVVARSFAPWLQGLAAVAALVSLFALLRVRPRRSVPGGRPSAPGAWLLALAAAAAAGLFALETARNPEGGWDAWGHWNRTARALVRAPAHSPLPFAPELAAAHPDYPLALPGAVAAGWSLGGEGLAWPAAVAALFALMLAAALHLGLGASRHVATALLVSVPCFAPLTANQYADGPLAAFWTLGAVLALRAFDEARAGGSPRPSWMAGGFCLAMAAWTKNEGVLLLGLLPLFLALELPRGRRIESAAWLFAGAMAPLTVLVGFKATLAPANDVLGTLGLESVRRLGEAGRWLELLRETSLHLVRFKDWGLTLPALLIAAVWLWRWAKEVPACRVLARCVAGLLAVYAFVFLVTPLDPVFHLKTAMGRLLFQVWPLFLLWYGRAWEAREASRGPQGQGKSPAIVTDLA